MAWISDKLPPKVGQYLCKDTNGKEFPNFWVSTFSGGQQWVTDGQGIEVAAWKPIVTEIKPATDEMSLKTRGYVK